RESIAGALAYFSFIPAGVFLCIDPYRTNRFVRFHSVQCLLLWLATIVLAAILWLLGLIILRIPEIGPLVAVLAGTVSVLAVFLLRAVLVVKAAQGEMFKLPWIGNIGERRSEFGR